MSQRIQNNFDEGKIPVSLEIRDGLLLVTLKDGRLIGTPLSWYPRLMNATPQQLENYELWAFGIHWEDLDEDLGIEGMLMGIHPKPPVPQVG
ncbi:MAG: DUF2442 domain-containing protein [Anaerolineae bacterium]|nr:DUF2442 domain-containing protein [Anaerolineae bacterium]